MFLAAPPTTSNYIPTTDKKIVVEKPSRVPELVFQCQLAHGSPTALISGFSTMNELYEKIANSFDGVTKDQILYCTRNVHRLEMDAILNGTLLPTDFLFAHIKGQKKEVELVKNAK